MDTFVAIDLTGYYNNSGVTSRAALGAGRFNAWGFALACGRTMLDRIR